MLEDVKQELILTLKILRPHGIKGSMHTFLHTDFASSFKKGLKFYFYLEEYHFYEDFKQEIDSLESILIDGKILKKLSFKKINSNILSLEEVSTREFASSLKGLLMYNLLEDTKSFCKLEENEFFYFDIIGCRVIDKIKEDELELGRVINIEQIGSTSYLVLEKDFLIPYIDRYILEVDIKNKVIFTKDSRYLKV